jgi:hypothetical protein
LNFRFFSILAFKHKIPKFPINEPPARTRYAPGVGTPPPELADRDELIERLVIALDRICAGRAVRCLILDGLRGVGKTVLLNRIEIDAEARSFANVKVEAPKERSLPTL